MKNTAVVRKIISLLLCASLTLGLLPALAEGMGFAEESASVKLYVFEDENNNGIRGKYEEAVQGVKIAAYAANGETMALQAEGVSGKDGTVLFEKLPAGKYFFKVELPEKYGFSSKGETFDKNSSIFEFANTQSATSSAITLNADNYEMGIGCIKYSFLSGSCFMDENLDGIWQEEEGTISGVKVEILTRKGEVISDAVSDENGNYVVNYVQPGDYILRATLPDGIAFTKYSKEGRERRSIITTAGESTASRDVKVLIRGTTDQNIGGTYSAVVKGKCFKDNIYNGVFDDEEEGLEGVKIELLKNDGTVVSTQISDENGEFEFDSLRNGTYRVQVTLPEGYVYTKTSDTENGNLFSSRNSRRDTTLSGFAVSYPQSSKIIIGAIHLATVSGKAYFDDDYSGAMDEEEKAAQGIVVTLKDESGKTVATDRTGADGQYKFESLNPGVYTLFAAAKQGYAFTKAGSGNVIENRELGKGDSGKFELVMGEDKADMGIGMVVPAKIEGTVFDDENENGMMDSGEVGLVGAKVSLIDADGNVVSKAIGIDGKFMFDTVMPGEYFVRYELVGNSYFTKTAAGGNSVSSEESYAETSSFSLSSGEKKQLPLCGGVALYKLEGKFFRDTNGNGKLDSEETSLANVEISISGGSGKEERIVTDETGSFAFESLVPGKYAVSYILPENVYTTRISDNEIGVTDNVNGQTIEILVDRNHIYSEQQIGAANHVSLEGKVWIDENKDGMFGIDEYVPSGEKIEMIDCYAGETVKTLTTDADGIFAAYDMLPGLYTIKYYADDDTSPAISGDSTFAALNDENGEKRILGMENILVRDGEEFRDARLGIVRTASVSGKVWIDRNGEIVPVEGAKIKLSTGTEVVTADDGAYSFDRLNAGTYAITAELPVGMIYVEQNDARLSGGKAVSIVTSNTGREGFSDEFSLRMGERKNDGNVGAVLSASLGDKVWLDENENGLQDIGEMGVPGVTLTLYRVGNENPVGCVTTDAFGYYCFNDLYPAQYVIRTNYPATVKPTVPEADVPLINSALQSDGSTKAMSLVSGARNYNADLGFVLTNPGKYPDGYGDIPTQDWTKLGSPDTK